MTTPTKTSKKGFTQRTKMVFGDPVALLGDLIKNSMAVKTLPLALRKKFFSKIKNLPKDKKLPVIHVLQKEQSRQADLKKKAQETTEEMLLKLKAIKRQYERLARENQENQDAISNYI
ncbi:MAG: hypothetical protein UT55_C0036G0004 [Candidatus Peregrinibacteria bacterium GW2011_GWE2_39_6]|nr:MAG: hypothetical protein UT36_C0011G0034 [Candidatus Peregrinibacteria bacterium GW2011_GWF2_39_17]KKR25614.1 MAG: hypothetical protein UT55_C0036G0004 [Candidatus Peregrinibacteria bacterium GW2011_GWE2_39_6]HCW32511.1 hypothetical protein [Candidatus Peregrinibacteria bacterium]